MKRLMTAICLSLMSAGALFSQPFILNTETSGLQTAIATNGVAVADYDLDGDLDVYFVAQEQYSESDPTTWNRLFRNNGDGTFVDATEAAGVGSRLSGQTEGSMGYKFGAAWGDFNNDGYPDLFLTNYGRDELYRNQGDGTFVEVTETAGVAGNATDHNTSAVWWDYDLDGDLDLYVSAWVGTNIMYENLSDGTFADVTEAAALADTGSTWTSIALDVNDDDWPDLYVVNDFGANRFYVNQGDKTFREATAEFGLENEGHGMGVTIGDYDNNGLFDIYLTNISDVVPNPLFANTGGYFVDRAHEAGVHDAMWGWGTEFFDCDHDGDEDLYVVNGFNIEPGTNVFFENVLEEGEPRFENVSEEMWVDGEAEARGLVVFDYDADGDLDLLVANFREAPYLYTNRTAQGNWLKVRLQGTTVNRNAFGSVVRVTAGNRTFHRHHDGVEFLGQSIQPIHVGLGYVNRVDEVLVEWPGGATEKVTDVAVNQTITIREGQGLVTHVRPAEPGGGVEGFELLGNFPNPFNASTAVRFRLPEGGRVHLAVFDVRGRAARHMERIFVTGGEHEMLWDGRNDAGTTVASGTYVYRVRFGRKVRWGRLVLLK